MAERVGHTSVPLPRPCRQSQGLESGLGVETTFLVQHFLRYPGCSHWHSNMVAGTSKTQSAGLAESISESSNPSSYGTATLTLPSLLGCQIQHSPMRRVEDGLDSSALQEASVYAERCQIWTQTFWECRSEGFGCSEVPSAGKSGKATWKRMCWNWVLIHS